MNYNMKSNSFISIFGLVSMECHKQMMLKIEDVLVTKLNTCKLLLLGKSFNLELTYLITPISSNDTTVSRSDFQLSFIET